MKRCYSKIAKKQIAALSPETKKEIRSALDALASDPYLGKPLRFELKGFYSIVIKRYRIIYQLNFEAKTVEIHTLGHRRTIYDDATQLLKSRQSTSLS